MTRKRDGFGSLEPLGAATLLPLHRGLAAAAFLDIAVLERWLADLGADPADAWQLKEDALADWRRLFHERTERRP